MALETSLLDLRNYSKKSMLLLMLVAIWISLLSNHAVHAQKTCPKYNDFFIHLNKYEPEFDQIAYTTMPVRVDNTSIPNLLSFMIVDKDSLSNRVQQITVSSNDTNFLVRPDLAPNSFVVSLSGQLSYNVNGAHRYVVELTATDNGLPSRSSKALVFVPLINYNVNPPQYTSPVLIAAAITLNAGSQLGILNAWDVDGDEVTFKLDPSNNQKVLDTIEVTPSGVVNLKAPLTVFASSFNFTVLLSDDGSCCISFENPNAITRESKMTVTLIIIEVNMHSPEFVPNSEGINYCEKKYQVYENTLFQIEIVAEDDDQRELNGAISLYPPDTGDWSPQYSFNLNTSFPQINYKRKAIVYNTETFDYENPKYGSNIMNIMFYAEDHGVVRRRGYCFMQIEILDVNDNVPVFAQRLYIIHIHDQYKTKQFNYRFVAIDKDSGLNGKVQYFMEPGNPIAPYLFNLALDGTLSIKNGSVLDDIDDQFQFQIYARDMSPTMNRSELVTVRVIKATLKLLPPYFSDFTEPEIRNVSEMTPRGSILRNFTITIQTNPTNMFPRCFLSPKPNPEWFKFEYLNTNQNISKTETCYLRVEDPLNYRISSSMVVYMVAELGNTLMTSTARELKIITIYLKEENINPPKFVTSTIEASVVEGEEDLNKIIAVAKAYDLDKTPPYNVITYEIEPNSNPDGYFTINSTTGQIRLRKRIQNKKNIPLEIIAKDGANGYGMNRPNQNSIYVDIKVIDFNDNPPSFSSPLYNFTVPENAKPGYVIGRVEVTDLDTDSFFNYSISDSTFGIRGLNDRFRSKLSLNFKEKAEIYLNNYLDYTKKSEYQLKVFVSDSQFFSSASMNIKVLNSNERAPSFINAPYVVYLDEESNSSEPIVRLSATLQGRSEGNYKYECYSTPYLDKEWFRLESKTGELFLTRPLNRDLPDGMSIYYLPISVTELGTDSIPPSPTTYNLVKIILNDINDNPPYLAYGSNYPLIINENDSSGLVELYVVDVDKVGPPFTFVLDNYTDLFGIQPINCPITVSCTDRARYQLFNKQKLDRNIQKSYVIPYTISDNGGNSANGTFELIVGDIDNNPQTDGSKQVKIVTFENNLQMNTFLGTLFVQDKDDWDLANKRPFNCSQNPPSFEFRDGLHICGPVAQTSILKDLMNLQCAVSDPKFKDAVARVDLMTDNVEFADVIDLTGLRISGVTAENFAKKSTTSMLEKSLLDVLQDNILRILEVNPQNGLKGNFIQVVTLRNYNANAKFNPSQIPNYDLNLFGSEVLFYVHKDEKLLSSRYIYHKLYANMNQLKAGINFRIDLLFDTCVTKPAHFCPANSFCKQSYIISPHSFTIDANATSLVGMDNVLSTECYCNIEVKTPVCFNGGTLHKSDGGSDYYCSCPDNTDGPRCEILALTFTPSSLSHSFALFKSIQLCDPLRIEFEFSTMHSKGLLLFNGPINRDALNFLAVEVFNNALLVHIGYTNLTFPNINVSDKNWHKVTISMSLNAAQVNLDQCYSQTVPLPNYSQMKTDPQKTDDVRLSLGGIPPLISKEYFYYTVLNVFEYNGCIRNLRVNGDLRNLRLSEKPNQHNHAEESCDCKYQNKCEKAVNDAIVKRNEFPWWIILAIIASLAVLASILAAALCSIRRKDDKEKLLQMYPGDDIRETIINYADGAGEENTENFNIGIMKKPVGPINTLMQVPNGTMPRELVAPNDQNMIYAYEGEGSDAGSLSSISSNDGDADLEFDYLPEWGPKFSQLSHLYYNETPGGNEQQSKKTK